MLGAPSVRGAGSEQRALVTTEIRSLVRLATPMALAHVGNQLLGVVDAAVVGRLGEVPLGAVGLGTMVFFAITVLGLGLMLGLDPLVAQAVGASEPLRARSLFWQGLWMALGLTVPLGLLIAAAAMALGVIGLEPATASDATAYVLSRLPGLPFFLVVMGSRSYLQGHGITVPHMLGVILANVINLPLSWLLVFGDAGVVPLGLPALGIPALGAAGAGLTSSVCTAVQCAVVLLAVRFHETPAGPVRRRFDRTMIRQALGLGFPVSMSLLAEVGVFALVGLLMGYLGSRALAAHYVALNLISMTFQVPLAIGAATAVRVGQAVGRADPRGTRLAGLVSLGVGGGFMVLSSLIFVAFPSSVASIITDKPAVIAAAAPLILIAAAFQIADGIQVVGAGALRGAGDTRFAMVANVVGHYLIGLPVGLGLAWGLGWGAPGLWWALSTGLTTVAVALLWRFLRISARPIARA